MATITIDQEVKMQASNIDEQGNVLFLDEERLTRKKVGFPKWKNHSNGLGIYNFLKEKVLRMDNKRWGLARKLYRFFIKYSVWFKEGGWKGKMYKKAIMLSPPMEKNTSTLVMPLNVDITQESEKVILPIDMLKESLKNATFIGGMDTCLCRESNGCKDFPHDLGCLFLGEIGRTVIQHGLGREFTYEEACARVDRAASLGLMAQGVWIEVEQLLWGIRNDQMDQMLEVCFCCPCCCIAMRLAGKLQPEDRVRFHPSGWTMVPDRTKCVGCGACAKEGVCPVEAISIGKDGGVVIDQEICIGCGECKKRCKFDVLKLKQTMPMRKDLKEYYMEDFNLDLKVWKDQEA